MQVTLGALLNEPSEKSRGSSVGMEEFFFFLPCVLFGAYLINVYLRGDDVFGEFWQRKCIDCFFFFLGSTYQLSGGKDD